MNKRVAIDTIIDNAINKEVTRKEYITEILMKVQDINMDVLYKNNKKSDEKKYTGTVKENMRNWSGMSVKDDTSTEGVVYMGFMMQRVTNKTVLSK